MPSMIMPQMLFSLRFLRQGKTLQWHMMEEISLFLRCRICYSSVSIHALERSWELNKVPRASGAVEGSPQGTQRRSPGRPVRTNEATKNYAPAQGGEYEKALIPLWWTKGWVRGIPPYVPLVDHPQYVRTCVRPAGGGLRRRRERQPVLRTSRPATLTPTKWGVWEGERTRAMLGYLSIQQCTSSNGEKGCENENASHQYVYHVPIQGALHRLQEICITQA